jgi:hypothetical protein
MAAPVQQLDFSKTINQIPLYYLKDFKINEKQDSKDVKDLYDLSDLKKIELRNSIKTTDDYKFKIFSMEIEDNLIENSNCDNSDLDITVSIYKQGHNQRLDRAGVVIKPAKDAEQQNKNLQREILKQYLKNNFDKICGRNIKFDIRILDTTQPNPPGTHKQAQKTIYIGGTMEVNLAGILHNIHSTYDIINFQDIKPGNIKKLNNNLEGKNGVKLIYIKVKGTEKYLTTFYNSNKLDLIAYSINDSAKLLKLVLKMKNDMRILYLINSIDDYNNVKKDKSKIHSLDLDFVNSNNTIDIEAIPDDKKSEYTADKIYKSYNVICCYIKNDNDDIKINNLKIQHIKYPKYNDNNDKYYFKNINNTIIFSNNLEMPKLNAAPPVKFNDSFHQVYDNILSGYDLDNFFINEVNINDSKHKKNIINAFKYLGYSKSLGIGTEFNLGVDNYKFK